MGDQQKPGGTLLGYMPQLDGLRAVAVLAVWFEHWGLPPIPGLRRISDWGGMGVWLFFVLSGFLITGILLRGRVAVESGGASVSGAVRTFYARRFLRILPVYLLALIVATILLPETRKLFWWHLTYTTNLWYGIHLYEHVPGAHFWSLAVEEQFYLIWPWLVLLAPRRHLLKIMLIVAVASVTYRLGYVLQPWQKPHVTTMINWSFGTFDRLALGAILSVLWETASHDRIRQLCRWSLWTGLAGMIAMQLLEAHNPYSRLAFALHPTAAAVLFFWLVDGAARGFRGPVGRLLQSPPVLYVGRISYGIYLFHGFVPHLLARFHAPLPQLWILRFPLLAGVTIAVASLSWYLLESPLNGLKRYFTYEHVSKHDGLIRDGAELGSVA